MAINSKVMTRLCLSVVSAALLLQLLVIGRKHPIANPTTDKVDDTATSSPDANITQMVSSSALPLWMKDYFRWHAQQRRAMRSEKSGKEWWLQYKFLVLRCTSQDRCGGLSDRLTSLPLFLFMAATTNRVLLVRWDRPFPLEDFLLPGPMLNWSVPRELQNTFDSKNNATLVSAKSYSDRAYFDGTQSKKLIASAQNQSLWLVEGNVHTGGASIFHDLVAARQGKDTRIENRDGDYASFYHELFPAIFSPTPSIQQLMKVTLRELKLIPNQYVVAHYRAKYPGEPYRESWDLSVLESTAINAVHCASSLAPSLPVYVASDAVASLQVIQRYTKQHKLNRPSVVTHLDVSRTTSNGKVTLLPEEDPPHLNFDAHARPSGFYSIFVDLLIMHQSRCVSYGAGGFGRFGSLLSFNASCGMAHTIRGRLVSCKGSGVGKRTDRS